MQAPRWLALSTRLAAAAALSLTCAACGGSVYEVPGPPDAGSSAISEAAGSVSVQMQLPVGSPIATASYTLRGPNSFYRASMMNFPDTTTVSFDIDPVPAQDGYDLEVTLTSPEGSNVCTSSGQFGVVDMMTTTVVLIPHCSQSAAQAATTASTASLQLTVDLPDGVSIDKLAFSLHGGDGFKMNDTWSVANDSALLFVVQNIPPGTGDAIDLSAMSLDGAFVCTATTTVNFVDNATTQATLVLGCQNVTIDADF
jgi:hypothetical protein